ncbi:MAG: 30S ribosomal protein S1 [Streptococcaceae bacterium]|jgi:small subunit ribosomal protein S1|nr:30S ribosomal protein S1 [Streptococcaceae bacterium]
MSDFESLLNSQEEIKVGDVVEGVVEQIDDSNKQLIVSLPGGLQGTVPVQELSVEPIENIKDVVSLGDKLDLVVYQEVRGNSQDDGIAFILSKNRLVARAAWEELQGKEGEIIHVKILKAVKGGLSVSVNGLRGFIPASLVEDHFVSDFSDYAGKECDVKIIEVNPAANRLILSHRAVLEEQKSALKTKIFENLHESDVVEGVVARITDFGAFINLGGVDGLVHVSQLAHYRVVKPSDLLAVGESVKAKILNIDHERERISLSIKALIPSPWDDIEEKVPIGAVLEGTVKRITDFGAFIEILPNVEGLVHISQISYDHISHPQEKLSEGEKVQVQVLELNPEAHRIALSIKALLEKPADFVENLEDEEDIDI